MKRKWEIVDTFIDTDADLYRLKDAIRDYEEQGMKTKVERTSFGRALYIK